MNKTAVIVTTLTIAVLGFAVIGSIFTNDRPEEELGDVIIDPAPIDQDPEVGDEAAEDHPSGDDNDLPNDGQDDVFDDEGVVTPPEPSDFPVDDLITDPSDGNSTDPPVDLPDSTTDPPVDLPDNSTDDGPDNSTDEDPDDPPDDDSISPFLYNGTILIEGIGNFEFDPSEIETVREDIFRKGFFSLFDILVHLGERGDIEFEYHYDEEMDTHVIDEINDMEDWWYWSYYDGGWREDNAWRMDMYPYKDRTTIRVYQEQSDVIEDIFDVFEEEVEKRDDDNGKVIVKKVILRGNTFDVTFDDVEVTAYNLRNDTFKEGVITAIDVIMSLGDQGKITYDLSWYETIGTAGIVKNYFVTMINGDEAYDTCGFVYETGYYRMNYRNHIHISSDHRVLVSPEYEEYFWICL